MSVPTLSVAFMALATLYSFAAPILLLIIRRHSGKEGFPYYVNEIGTDIMEASFRLTPQAATDFSVACGDYLNRRGVDPRDRAKWILFHRGAMQESVKLAFDEAGVHNPFTQMDVHIVEPK